MNENKKMEIVYVEPSRLDNSYTIIESFPDDGYKTIEGFPYRIIDGFPIQSVKIIAQNLDCAGFVELANHFKGVFDKCEFRVYARPDKFDQKHIFPQPNQYSKDNPYDMLKEYDLWLDWINPALFLDPNKTLTHEGITRIHAELEGSLPEEGERWGTGHRDSIDLQLILEKEVFTKVCQFKEGWWQNIIDKVIDQLNKPYFISTNSNTPVSSLKLLNILHKHYGIKSGVIDANEQIRSVIINRLSRTTPKSNVTSKITNK